MTTSVIQSEPGRSALFEGTIRHRRYSPKERSFSLRSYHALIDVDEIGQLAKGVCGFSARKFGLSTIRAEDHFRGASGSLRERVESWLARRGRPIPGGRIELHTNLAVLGHTFNPISWWFLYAPDDGLAHVIAEVNNTFGDSYSYLLDAQGSKAGGTADKMLHVSPFMERDGMSYRFRVRAPGSQINAQFVGHIDVLGADGSKRFDATVVERRVPFTSRNLARLMIRYPLVPLQTIARIHAQAARVYLRRAAPFHTRPEPYPNDYQATITQPQTTQALGAHMPRTDLPALATKASARRAEATRADAHAAETVDQLLQGITFNALEVRYPDGTLKKYGDGADDNPPRIEIVDWSFFADILGGATVGLGESYVAGAWRADDPVAALRVLIRNRPALRSIGAATLARAVGDRAFHWARANRPGAAKKNIEAHYDLSNELYELFLDETMTYSCAVFPDENMSLAEAQRAKWERLARSMNLQNGQHVFEIGCGWGGFAIWAAQNYDARVTGVTLSDKQYEWAVQAVKDAGVDKQVDILLQDYRDTEIPDGGFDRLVSIEMLEAVGHRYLPQFFEKVDQALAPDGLAAIQVITIPEQRYANYRRRPDFIQRYVFPGGHLPSLEAMTSAMRKSSNLVVHRVDDIGMDYAETLRRWRENFHANLDNVGQLGFDESFVRLWDFYLLYCEAAFAERYVLDLQLVLTRTSNPSLGDGQYRPAPVATPRTIDVRDVTSQPNQEVTA